MNSVINLDFSRFSNFYSNNNSNTILISNSDFFVSIFSADRGLNTISINEKRIKNPLY